MSNINKQALREAAEKATCGVCRSNMERRDLMLVMR